KLNSSDMRGCDLRGADLRNTNMHRTVLTGSDLRDTRIGRLGIGDQRMCISPATFKDVNWERDELERILEMINLNPDYEVRYEIVPRAEEQHGN
ncbi:MAG: pentapeptide repeat-containing protein, partial [Chloroflexi bacterium]|nr:pentapeptide repeat-containing protein [Chloroflexota bacterium]